MQKKIYTKDIQRFDIEYGIYFTSETAFLIFLECIAQVKIFYKFCPKIEINSMFNIEFFL